MIFTENVPVWSVKPCSLNDRQSSVEFLFVSSRPKVAAHPAAQVYYCTLFMFVHPFCPWGRTDCAVYWCGEITNWLHSPGPIMVKYRSHYAVTLSCTSSFCLHNALPRAAARSSVETFHWPFAAKHQSFEAPSSCTSQSDTTALWCTWLSAQNNTKPNIRLQVHIEV